MISTRKIVLILTEPGPAVMKKFMLNSAEHDFFLLINVKMKHLLAFQH